MKIESLGPLNLTARVHHGIEFSSPKNNQLRVDVLNHDLFRVQVCVPFLSFSLSPPLSPFPLPQFPTLKIQAWLPLSPWKPKARAKFQISVQHV